MTIVVETQAPPELNHVTDWLERVSLQEGVRAAYEAVLVLSRRYPQHAGLLELLQWYQPQWWEPIHFGAIRMERRRPEHFEFMWSLVLDEAFSRRLKHIPPDLTPNDLLHLLNRDYVGIVPKRRGIQWVVYKDEQPIGVSMFVGINFENRMTEQILGILPEFDASFLVGDTYCASLLFAYNTLGLHRVAGNIYDDNEKTALLQERLGFRREGVLREAVWNEAEQRYMDVIQIAMLRSDFERSRVLQRFIARETRPSWLMQTQDWPRKPLTALQE